MGRSSSVLVSGEREATAALHAVRRAAFLAEATSLRADCESASEGSRIRSIAEVLSRKPEGYGRELVR